jgi:hypothetical protein
LAFKIDEEEIEWRFPKVRHLRGARNALTALAEQARETVADRDEDDADAAGMLDDVQLLVAAWVMDVHDNIGISGDLPKDVDDWPAWLVNMQFPLTVTEHWGTSPFG